MKWTTRRIAKVFLTVAAVFLLFGGIAYGKSNKPNILVIWGDDVGQSNISAYTMGMMGYQTPNIDRIANEGILFTDYYGEQSCTAGRSSFITGQSVFRTGLSKVGLPGAKEGMHEKDLPQVNSVRTTLVTVTNTCPPTTALMSSSATSITLMRKKSLKTKITRRTRNSANASVPVGSFIV
jgi:hypothetical protein